ncbi:hypothetical protein [Flavobacterium sp. UBA6135]|uniref:hypothetical protein n=1 Tax=Flavobacterium sp. UBA6135 TaxID=1946553 RepID=UPI0025C4AFB3|nr:hypothetical protein [Flavobacterium sp. UBA6135]
MAKFEGIFEIQGTMKGMTFYKSKDGLLIRAKGGVSKQRIKNDPAFQRTRENGAEFSHNSQMGQLLRQTVSPLLRLAKDYRVSSRLNRVMSQIKNLDAVSERGERQVPIGIGTAAGKALLTGFDFNQNAAFRTVFRTPYSLDPVTGIVTVTDFQSEFHLGLPEGTTHASLSSAVVGIDFATRAYDTQYSNKVNFAISSGSQNITLTPVAMPIVTETQVYFFLIEFFQEINGVQYPLKKNSHNVLHILDVV